MAAHLFGYLFTGATLADPERPLRRADELVAWMAGIDYSAGPFGLLVSNTVWTQLQPYVLESVALWQQARVAAVRTTGSNHPTVDAYLLRRGEHLLRAIDPVGTLRGWLGVESGLR